jgi:hypothetical protein
MTFYLNMHTGLPLVRAAFEAGILQAETAGPGDACWYAGPCAIGAMLPQALREEADAQGSVDFYTVLERVDVDCMDAEQEDMFGLQELHDTWATAKPEDKAVGKADFGERLAELEAKYLPVAA